MKKGRPTYGDAPMKRVNVMLSEEVIQILKSEGVGNGNLSKGIRRAAYWIKGDLAALKEAHAANPESIQDL